jgi:hypothetical protein
MVMSDLVIKVRLGTLMLVKGIALIEFATAKKGFWKNKNTPRLHPAKAGKSWDAFVWLTESKKAIICAS